MRLKDLLKVIADKKYGEVLGVHIIGPAAAELINEASTIIEMEITVEEMLKTIHGQPNLLRSDVRSFCGCTWNGSSLT